ncbi:ABC transporter ATP-binding protein, partial [Candidatus Omnitrophota bacterium]
MDVWEKYRVKFIQDGRVSWEELWALQDIGLAVNKGEVLGVIGENGAGKTTLLKLIAGTLVPDRGQVNVQGKLSALMELGAGFNPEFTGRENIMINSRIYGLDEQLLEQRMGLITEFAGLGKFIDAPVKYYSQGMFMRLAFALAIYVEPDILLIDDILAVGDEEAQQKCVKKIFQLKQSGKTIVVVSHNMNMIERLCNQVIHLEKGRIVHRGSAQEVISRYQEVVGDKSGISILEKDQLRAVFNNGRIILSYGGTTLTKDMGGYFAFFVPSLNSWSSSLNLNWRINSDRPNAIIAEGLNQGGAIDQKWDIKIENNELHWQLELKDHSAKDSHIDLLLIPEYKGWEGLKAEGEFGSFTHKSNWQEVNLDNYQDNIIGAVINSRAGKIPFLTLEVKNKDNQLKLFNTGYNQGARVIQSYLMKGSHISIIIKFFPDAEMFEKYIQQFRDRILLKEQQEKAELCASRTISSGYLRLFADPEAKALRLYYKDREITKSSGLHTPFLLGQVWYDIYSSEWQAKKQKNRLILNLFWEQLGFALTWIFSIRDNCLDWKINSYSNQSFKLETLKFSLSIVPDYKTFFCAHQQGDFPDQFTNNWQDMNLEEPKAEFFGVRRALQFPALIFQNNQNFSCFIQNSDALTACHTLQLSLPGQSLKQNRHITFSTKITVLEDEALINDYIKEQRKKLLYKQEEDKRKLLLKQKEELAQLRASLSISSGKLHLYADLETKSLRLYFNNKEITKGSGINISFYALKKWFNLIDAQWQVKKISQKELILTFYYKSVSLLQVLMLSCRDRNT